MCIEIMDPGFLPVQLDVAVRLNGREKQRHSRLVLVVGQVLMQRLLRDFVEMLVDAVHGAVLLNQRNGSLLADLRHTRYVVRGIAHERFDINKLPRRHPVGRLDILRIIVLNCGLPHAGLRNPDPGALRRNLQQIPVSGDQADLHAPALRFAGQRAQNVIRLKPRLLPHCDTHGGQHFLDQRHLLPQLVRHRMARSLVIRIIFMAEGRRVDVKSHRQIVRLLLLQNFEQNIQKSVHCARVHTFAVGEIRHPVERPVQNTVSVNQNEFFRLCVRHVSSLSFPPELLSGTFTRSAAWPRLLPAQCRLSQAPAYRRSSPAFCAP